MELFFDTETSGLFNFKNFDVRAKNFPWIVQLGAILAEEGIAYAELNVIIQPGRRKISAGALEVHHISVELAEKAGLPELTVAETFLELLNQTDVLVAHNINFDLPLMQGLFHRVGIDSDLLDEIPKCCTMLGTTGLCRLPGKYGNFKWPKLQELHNHLFGVNFVGAHDAMFDIKATMKCYYELKRIGWIK